MDQREQADEDLASRASKLEPGTAGSKTASNRTPMFELPEDTSHSMIRRIQFVLLIPLLMLLLGVIYGLHSAPGKPAQPALIHEPEPGSSSAKLAGPDFDRHVNELKKKLPSSDFSIVVQPPFVVIGDEPADAVKEHSERTVKWAVDKLKQDYFTKDPNEILDIWLFKYSASYEKNATALFGEKPTTPYGYYSSAHKALVMNISTGGGTLVHEIVHPFIEANFPACPAWFNEGLGSLYEQCGEVDGHIHGFTNWRLPGLQKAINQGSVPPFRKLMAMNTSAFYNDDDKGTNYAQSRYLCYYLQQRGLLIRFYREFHAHRDEDPTGYKTLQRILRVRDMNAFKKRWEQYVLGLKQGYELTVRPN